MRCKCCASDIPVRPVVCKPSLACAGTAGPREVEAIEDEEEIGVHPDALALGELIVGQKAKGERKIKALPNPNTMADA